MGKLVTCDCGRVSDLDYSTSCHYCGRRFGESGMELPLEKNAIPKSNQLTLEKMDELITAQYRAAAASRALPSLIVSLLAWGIPSSICSCIGIVWYLSAQDSYYYRSQGLAVASLFLVLGGIFALVGVLVGMHRASRELDKSRVPGYRG